MPAEDTGSPAGTAGGSFTRKASSLEADLAGRTGKAQGPAARGRYHEARHRLNRKLAHGVWAPAGAGRAGVGRAALAEQALPAATSAPAAGHWCIARPCLGRTSRPKSVRLARRVYCWNAMASSRGIAWLTKTGPSVGPSSIRRCNASRCAERCSAAIL